MNTILSFGEILIRQQSLGSHFFDSPNNLLRIYPGGAEANVAASLAQMGNKVEYVSAFPQNSLSQEIVQKLNGLAVGTHKIIWSGDRLGSYILLSANGLSSGEVIYDRKYSSFSQLSKEDFPFDSLLEDVFWLHWSALTPALNLDMADLMEILLNKASEKGIQISVDLNYRSKLWQYGKAPIEVMPTLVKYCDVIMGNIWASNKMLGTAIDEQLNRNSSKETYFEFAKQNAQEIRSLFPKVKYIANTFRFMDRPTHNLFYGTFHTETEDVISEVYETEEVIDRIGSGDAFMAGLIHALSHQWEAQKVVDTATGAGYQKLFVEGDFGNGKF